MSIFRSTITLTLRQTPKYTTLKPFHQRRNMSDEYSAKAAAAPSLTEKLTDLRAFLKANKAVLLVTKAADGSLHARTMAPSEITKDWKFRFTYDKESHKDDELDVDDHVNICQDGTALNNGWVSIAGRASRPNDPALVEHLYTPDTKAWFGDKGDGVHDGSAKDPRIGVIEVAVDEIRHFHEKKTTIGLAVDVVASAISGKVATPGELRTITGQEIGAAWAKGELKEP